MSQQGIKVKIFSPQATAKRICEDNRVGLFLATTWHRYFSEYTPMQTGNLRDSVSLEPFKVTYNQPYAHYQWEGIKYNDPLINASGWFDVNAGRWYSHSGVTKVRTEIPLNYSQEQNPLATSHWEEPAQQAFKATVATQVSAYIRRLR